MERQNIEIDKEVLEDFKYILFGTDDQNEIRQYLLIGAGILGFLSLIFDGFFGGLVFFAALVIVLGYTANKLLSLMEAKITISRKDDFEDLLSDNVEIIEDDVELLIGRFVDRDQTYGILTVDDMNPEYGYKVTHDKLEQYMPESNFNDMAKLLKDRARLDLASNEPQKGEFLILEDGVNYNVEVETRDFDSEVAVKITPV